jgi:hypothetical protein
MVPPLATSVLPVMPGLDPGIQVFRRFLDGRVKPGHDIGWFEVSESLL